MGPSAFRIEVDTLKYLARVNEVKTKREKWIRFPTGKKSPSQLKLILQTFSFRPVFYNPLTFGKLFVHLKDRIPRSKKSGVNRIECKDSDALNIGETIEWPA